MCDEDGYAQGHRDYQDEDSALAWADTEGLRKKGRKWLLTKLWQQQAALSGAEGALARATARAELAEARLREMEIRTEPLVARNRRLNSALGEVERALTSITRALQSPEAPDGRA